MSENYAISWTSNYSLKWTDFKAELNPAVFKDSHSAIKYGFTWTVDSDKVNDKVVFLIDNIQIVTEFHPLLSSFRTLDINENLLKHEQGHFDLAELIKIENLEELQNKFYNIQFSTRGQNDDQRKQFAKVDSGKMISKEIEKLEELLRIRRQQYNEQTNFCQNQEKQIEYDLIFNNLR